MGLGFSVEISSELLLKFKLNTIPGFGAGIKHIKLAINSNTVCANKLTTKEILS
jgi:hypothetical protein